MRGFLPRPMRAKNIDMQCLRAIAIILVVMQHYKARLPTTDAYVGMFNDLSLWTGVDIFFALSGLLIFRSINAELARHENTLNAAKSFFLKRIRRLVPALLLGLAASILVSAIASSWPNHDPLSVSTGALAALVGVSNFYWSACVSGVLSSCGSADFNGVTWSLSLEWQLYAAICLLICTLGNRKALILALAVAIVLSIGPAPSFSIPWATRSQAFVFGCLLGTAEARRKLALPRPASLLILLFGLALCTLSPIHARKEITLLLIGTGGALCLISTMSDSLFSRRSPFTALLVWIGDRSYSVYLLHLPCILVAREALARLGLLHNDLVGILAGLVVALPLIALASDLSYRLVEQRFLSQREQPAAALA